MVHFYEKYQLGKVDGVGTNLQKYIGKEDNLFCPWLRNTCLDFHLVINMSNLI